MRASATGTACGVVSSINSNQAAAAETPPQTGSLYDLTTQLAKSVPVATAQATVAAVANGAQSMALLAAPGLVLAAYQSLAVLERLQLPGSPIPTGFWSTVGGAVGGAVVGAIVGGAVGGPWGAVIGAGVGAIAGGVTCSVSAKICDSLFSNDCQRCYSDADCESGNNCLDQCCSGTSIPVISGLFLQGKVGCSGGATSCKKDSDCSNGSLCVENCCLNPQTYASSCSQASKCTTDAQCLPGNSCLFGCCLGVCGENGTACAAVPVPNSCGGTGPGACPSGSTCDSGCCNGIIY
jgi:hypothetical protein